MVKPETIELSEDFIVLTLPSDSVEVKMEVKVYFDGGIKTVVKTLGMKDLREAFREAEMWYTPPDIPITLTDKGKEMFDG